MTAKLPLPLSVTPEDLRRTLTVLEAVVADRSLLTCLPEETRVALLKAAGRVSLPARNELAVEARARRRARQLAKEAADRAAYASAEINRARTSSVFVPPPFLRPEDRPADGPELKVPRACYCCKKEYRRVHFFYHAHCKTCGDRDYEKRFQTADLRGKTALVTGARVKIGFQIALKLLRAGARVIACTRFPHDAARRYAAEPDFREWSDRLQIHGLDLRHSPSVEIFARYLNTSLDRLDILVNNACQTVRRPAGWHAPLLAFEETPVGALPGHLRPLLESHETLKTRLAAPTLEGPSDPTGLATLTSAEAGIGLRESARLSLKRYTYEDAACGKDVFPERLDADLQQVDLRTMNSWRLTLAEVETPELLEVMLINAVAPFILAARLKPLLKASPARLKHVVNVSAMEGVFSRGTKTDKHPHTNMAKAALNMMTLTAAPDYAKNGILMNAVDTGWVTDEDPAQHAARKKDELGFQPPLDIVDGAARVLDPVFAAENGAPPVTGKFLKDYRISSW